MATLYMLCQGMCGFISLPPHMLDIDPSKLMQLLLDALKDVNHCSWWNGGARQSSENHVGVSFKNNFLYANIPCKRNCYVHRLYFSLQGT